MFKEEYFEPTRMSVDSAKSGDFKGILSQQKFDSLIALLKACNYKNLAFPDVQCCDGVITTIIIYSDGQRKYLKSMTPPEKSWHLISFLQKIGENEKLARTSEMIDIER